MKILILGASMVQCDAIRELKKRNHEVYVMAYPQGPGFEFADGHLAENFLDLDKVTNYMKRVGTELLYSVGSDIAMPIIAEINKTLELDSFIDKKTALICNNKGLLRKTLGENFRGNISFQVVKNREEDIVLDFPLIMKPIDSQGQRGVYRIEDYEDYCKYFLKSASYSTKNEVIIERYIDGYEVSVNGYMIEGEMIYYVISDRMTWNQYPGGIIHKHIVPSLKVTQQAKSNIVELIKRTVKAISIKNGPVYFQLKVKQDVPYLIEVTPRLDGCHLWSLIKAYAKIDLLKLTFDHLINNDISEIEKMDINSGTYVLEFSCQEPGCRVSYNKLEKKKVLESVNYYKEGQCVRPINNYYEKTGYVIYRR